MSRLITQPIHQVLYVFDISNTQLFLLNLCSYSCTSAFVSLEINQFFNASLSETSILISSNKKRFRFLYLLFTSPNC